MRTQWGTSPRLSVEGACRRLGERNVALACMEVLNGGELSAELGYILSGPASSTVLEGGAGGRSGYWPRVWALRGLLYAWDDDVLTAVARQLDDESWRVREMTLRVIRQRRLDDALERVASLQDDPIARVRGAAQRALVALTTDAT